MIEQFRAYIAQIETLRLRNMLVDKAWIVISAHGFPTTFDFDDLPDGRRKATAARSCSLMDAPQFTKHDAESLASTCVDGTGALSVAMFINDAIDLHQRQQQDAINYLETRL